MIIRDYDRRDLEKIVSLFYHTVHSINLKDYSQEQVDAWAPVQLDLDAWHQSLSKNHSMVAIKDNQIVGFGDIDKTGYLDRLYVHKDYQGQDVATKICDALEKQAVGNRVRVHASITAKPFFEKRGHHVLKKQQVERRGVLLTHYLMEKSTSPN